MNNVLISTHFPCHLSSHFMRLRMRSGVILLLIGLFFLNIHIGLAQGFPKGCEAKGYYFENYNLVLNETGEQRLFLIYNHHDMPVELQREQTPDTFMSPNLLVQLGAGFWSAFASDMAHLVFECHSRVDDNERRIDCGDVLSVCEYPRVKFALSNMGNYWVSANKPQRDVLEDTAAKGIYLKW